MSRILVVEDESRLASFLARALTAHGFDVEVVSDAVHALRLARDQDFAAVLLDLMLPGGGGPRVLKELAATDPETPVIVVSAVADARAKVRCLELGAADYLVKPFALAELMARVRTRMKHPAHGAALSDRVLTAGPICLDLQRRKADAGAGPVQLTTREFRLLELLMRNDGGVATREEILSDVWGFSFDPGTNVIDVYIARLRSKLGCDVIETVRGVGYALHGEEVVPAAVPSRL